MSCFWLHLSQLLTSCWVQMLTTRQVRCYRTYKKPATGSTNTWIFQRGEITVWSVDVLCVSVYTLTSLVSRETQVPQSPRTHPTNSTAKGNANATPFVEKRKTYIRQLFLKFSCAFNAVIPQMAIRKPSNLGLSSSMENWVLDFPTNRCQTPTVKRFSIQMNLDSKIDAVCCVKN